MPIRLALRSQIAMILSFLFMLAMLLVGYFNVTILVQVLVSNAHLEYRKASEDLCNQMAAVLPSAAYTPEGLRQWMAEDSRSLPLFGRLENLWQFHILDSKGQPIWSYGAGAPQILAINQFKGLPPLNGQDWGEFCQADGNGHLVPVQSINPIVVPAMSYEFYHTTVVDKKTIGGFHTSFQVPEVQRKLHIVVWGNVLLCVVFALTAVVAISLWVDNAIHRPLSFILQAQEQLGKGDFNAQIPFGGGEASDNEIANISSSFNHMTTELSRFQAQLMQKSDRLMVVNEQYRLLNEQLEAQVLEKTRELREFFSLITHELKVPLAAIQGYTLLVLNSRTDDLTDKQRTYMQSIGTATWHLLSLVRNMMDSVKYDAGKMHYYFDYFGLTEIIAEVESHLAPAMNEHRVTLAVTLAEGCEMVYGDRTKIGQVLINLISNAARFSPQDGVVEVRAESQGTLVRILVTDHGPGIAAADLPRLFDRFTQFGTADASAQGLGLGLYIVSRILEGHGQTVQVESTPGVGTIFTFTVRKGPDAMDE